MKVGLVKLRVKAVEQIIFLSSYFRRNLVFKLQIFLVISLDTVINSPTSNLTSKSIEISHSLVF